jgi:hypothetical protein
MTRLRLEVATSMIVEQFLGSRVVARRIQIAGSEEHCS